LKWDSRREERGKRGKFDNLWIGPYTIHAYRGNNAYFLKEMDGVELHDRHVNGRMSKHYVFQEYKNLPLKPL